MWVYLKRGIRSFPFEESVVNSKLGYTSSFRETFSILPHLNRGTGIIAEHIY